MILFLFSLNGNPNKMWLIVDYRLFIDYALIDYSQL